MYISLDITIIYIFILPTTIIHYLLYSKINTDIDNYFVDDKIYDIMLHSEIIQAVEIFY